jgi:hypothetical protein
VAKNSEVGFVRPIVGVDEEEVRRQVFDDLYGLTLLVGRICGPVGRVKDAVHSGIVSDESNEVGHDDTRR